MWLTGLVFIVYNNDRVPAEGFFCLFSKIRPYAGPRQESRPQPETAVAEPDKPA